MTPKKCQKSNVRIEGHIENESCSTTWVDPKTVVQPYPHSRNSPLGPKKVKNDSKIKEKPISELMETYRIKVLQLNE